MKELRGEALGPIQHLESYQMIAPSAIVGRPVVSATRQLR